MKVSELLKQLGYHIAKESKELIDEVESDEQLNNEDRHRVAPIFLIPTILSNALIELSEELETKDQDG